MSSALPLPIKLPQAPPSGSVVRHRALRLPVPHPGQVTVRNTAKRINVLSAGRRWRKSTMAIAISAESAAQGLCVVWGAPTYDQAYAAWEEAIKALKNVAVFNQTRMTAQLGQGSIQFRSLDNPDNVRGKTADVVVIDEAGDVMPGAWYEVFRPMLIDTNGVAWIIGTPKGRNWFYREYKKGLETPQKYACWNAPTRGCFLPPDGSPPVYDYHALENPYIPFEEIVSLWETMPERSFRQEILAEFVEDGGGVFRNVQQCVHGIHGDDMPQPKRHYVIGVDWGRVDDFTVFVVMDAKDKRVVQVDRFNQVSYEIQKGRLAILHSKWGSRPSATVEIVAEQNSIGDPLIESLNTAGIPVQPFVTSFTKKEMVIQDLSLRIERGQISFPDHKDLLEELVAFTCETTPSGNIRYSAPTGGHDDCVMALAIASHHAFSHSYSMEAPYYGRARSYGMRRL